MIQRPTQKTRKAMAVPVASRCATSFCPNKIPILKNCSQIFHREFSLETRRAVMSVENMFNLQMKEVGGLIEISQSSLAGRIPDNDTLHLGWE